MSTCSALSDCEKILKDARESTERLEKARKSASETRQALQDVVKIRERNLETMKEVGEMKSSIDDQWEAFKKKFDDLTKLAVERMAGLAGLPTTGVDSRPPEIISEARAAQVLHRAANVVVLTGAGISAESGIPTFRGADGFWTIGSQNYQPQEMATWSMYDKMPLELWRWYQYRWGICRKAKPNTGHYALVELDKMKAGGVWTVTQNIDGLHLDAGTRPERLAEIHGRIDEMRCDERLEGACLHGVDLSSADNFEKVRGTIVKTPTPAEEECQECLHTCSKCGMRQRPKILWFDESYNESLYKYNTVTDAVDNCDVLLIVGTMLTTGLPRRMLQMAKKKNATILRIDPEVDMEDPDSKGMLYLQGKSGEILPRVIEELKLFQKEPVYAPLVTLPSSERRCDSPALSVKSGSSTRASTPKSDSPAAGSGSSAVRMLAVELAKKRASSTPAQMKRSTVSAGSAIAGLGTTVAGSAPTKHAVAGSATKGSPARATGRSSSMVARARAQPAEVAPARKPSRRTVAAAPAAKPSGTVVAKGVVEMRKPAVAMEGGAVGFFVYGTLRSDDDSGASWTKAFCEDMVAEPSILHGASLYIDGAYPAVNFEQTRCSVRGVLLRPQDASQMAAKLENADRIEGYPDLYERVIAEVQTASGRLQPAYVYHRTGRTKRKECVRIPDGDWLSRVRG
eukprot:TRINITY_DN10777_c0_g3_i1.p1 TRINITY_DN10777_c0_g3~~TRINITY_DN10777_c0_g3_i1.p1  ORF type:complete len:708 (+),score=131.17 TRINITY_DN10777_c0_g3_i1:75-2126(+)